MTLAPDYDFGDLDLDAYADVLIQTFAGILAIAEFGEPWCHARHVKFHLSSPADRQFFAALGRHLHGSDQFESVHVKGAWLYVTTKEAA